MSQFLNFDLIIIVFRRDRVTLIEAEEENKRMEELRLDEEKQRDERKKESVRVRVWKKVP